jgi:hypothetical protein
MSDNPNLKGVVYIEELGDDRDIGFIAKPNLKRKHEGDNQYVPPVYEQSVGPGFAAASTHSWTDDLYHSSQGSMMSNLSCDSDFSIPEPDIATFSSILGSGKELIRETITTLFNEISNLGEHIIAQTNARQQIRDNAKIEQKKAEINTRIAKHNDNLSQLKKAVLQERQSRIEKVAELEAALHLLIIEERDILTNNELLRTGLPELFTNKDFKWWTDTIDAKDTEIWLMNYIRQTDILLAIQQTGIIDTIRCRKGVLPGNTATITLADLILQTIIEGALIYSDGLSLDPDAASYKIIPNGLIKLLNDIDENAEIDYQSIWTTYAKPNEEVDQLFAVIPVTGVEVYHTLAAAMGTPATPANATGAPAAQARGMTPFADAAVVAVNDHVDEATISDNYDESSFVPPSESEPSFQASGRWTVHEDAWQMKYENSKLILPDGTPLEEVESILENAKKNIENIRKYRESIAMDEKYIELMADLHELSDKYVTMINELYTKISAVKAEFIQAGTNIDIPLDQIRWTTIINGILLEYSIQYDSIFKARLELIKDIQTMLSSANTKAGGKKSRKHKKHFTKKSTRKYKKRYTRKLHKKHKRVHTKKH